MRSTTEHLEKMRLTDCARPSTRDDGMNGVFLVHVRGCRLTVVASNGRDWAESGLAPPVWEHVSVSMRGRCPLWYEMAAVKDLFFEPHELVLQFHPPQAEHINLHENCLHLWRPVGIEVPLPPRECV